MIALIRGLGMDDDSDEWEEEVKLQKALSLLAIALSARIKVFTIWSSVYSVSFNYIFDQCWKIN